MSGYTKVFSSIIFSTVWGEPKDVKILWVTMLAMADPMGTVEASVPGLARAAQLTIDECRAALGRLEAPDPDSKNPANEGRRVAKCEGGWSILNYLTYRDKMTVAKKRQQGAVRQKRYRERQQAKAERDASPEPDPPDDWNGSPHETTCPLDLATKAEKILPEMVTRLPGSTLEQLRASANRCVAHYTIGRGMGQKRRHWMKVLRGWVTKDHGDNNLKNGGKKTDLQQILERAARIQAEAKT